MTPMDVSTSRPHTLHQEDLWFFGLDVIADYLTEINVTSSTGAYELGSQFEINIVDQFVDVLKKQLNHTIRDKFTKSFLDD